jgi:hypothetical protein
MRVSVRVRFRLKGSQDKIKQDKKRHFNKTTRHVTK